MAKALPNPENKVSSKEKEMSFLDHLEELRWHLLRSIVAIVAFAIILFVFKEFTFKIIMAP